MCKLLRTGKQKTLEKEGELIEQKGMAKAMTPAMLQVRRTTLSRVGLRRLGTA